MRGIEENHFSQFFDERLQLTACINVILFPGEGVTGGCHIYKEGHGGSSYLAPEIERARTWFPCGERRACSSYKKSLQLLQEEFAALTRKINFVVLQHFIPTSPG